MTTSTPAQDLVNLKTALQGLGTQLGADKQQMEAKANPATVSTSTPTAAQGNNGDVWYQVDS